MLRDDNDDDGDDDGGDDAAMYLFALQAVDELNIPPTANGKVLSKPCLFANDLWNLFKPESIRICERLPQEFQEICFPITPSKSNQIRIFFGKSVEFRICEQTALDYRALRNYQRTYYAKPWSKLEIGFQLDSGAPLSVINCLGNGC
uniref:Uncharacterized protein n=1 Tax=Glossina pallidipes TaxID=7398 RepID=A0A1A9ZCV3_GLOPL